LPIEPQFRIGKTFPSSVFSLYPCVYICISSSFFFQYFLDQHLKRGCLATLPGWQVLRKQNPIDTPVWPSIFAHNLLYYGARVPVRSPCPCILLPWRGAFNFHNLRLFGGATRSTHLALSRPAKNIITKAKWRGHRRQEAVEKGCPGKRGKFEYDSKKKLIMNKGWIRIYVVWFSRMKAI